MKPKDVAPGVQAARGRQLRKTAILCAWLLSSWAGYSEIPISGSDVESLRPIDTLVMNFMTKHGVPGCAAGFVKDGRLVYARGFGYADRSAGEPVRPDSLFRIASLSKAITAVAILKLVEDGKLSLDESAFARLDYPAPTYRGAAVDPRLMDITIRQLLHHTAGWDRDTARNPDGNTGFDPTVDWTAQAARELGVTAPAGAEDIVHWMMGQPLQCDPGTQYHYSNLGYCVLGRVIERVTGTSYESYARSLLRRAGIRQMRIGGSRRAERFRGEVVYYDYSGAPLARSIFPRDEDPVSRPYNLSVAAMDAHGGWIGSVIDVLRFVTAVDGRGSHTNLVSAASQTMMTGRVTPPWKAGEEPYYGMGWLVRDTPGNWWHTGALPGTGAEMIRAGNGFTWVILCNLRPRQDRQFFSDLDQLGWRALAAVTLWPANDLFKESPTVEKRAAAARGGGRINARR